jgi:plasmid stabilization system protein ParE
MAKVIWTEPALAQLELIIGYIALDKPEAARAVAGRIFDVTDHIGRFVRMGKPIHGFPHKNYRQAWIKPCWLYYRLDKDAVYILHVRRAEKLFRVEDLAEDAQ